ncbi:AMP-binding protein [Geomesophilobacter sediminis]|uniref:AMP-binding protein n=1 Tax=Geomesophilobacter sediminis TaxID=2798584 RepID=A0A8J7LUP7_9BACT|nr:AMP-binding protein [Geomesophilobacter sediminis]MBJ6723970.1 AMP-binding protein [Geomesophilobacter sediminis]
MQTLIDLFESFASYGERPVFVDRTGVRRLTASYAELDRRARKLARLFAEHGVAPGDRVLLWGANSSWWGASFWGILAAGAVAVPVDFMSERERAETIAQLTSAKLVLQSRYKLEQIGSRDFLFFEDLPYLVEGLEPIAEIARPKPEDAAQLIYTSGTTGNPKGVILTHANLVANLASVNRHIPVVTPEFTFLSLLPLSHMFEQMGGFFTPLSRGGRIVYLRTLKPSALLEALAEEDVYAVIAVPRLLQLLKTSIERQLAEKHLTGAFRELQKVAPRLSPKLRKLLFAPVQRKFGKHFTLFVSGGAPLDPDTFRFWQQLGFRVLEGYGLTECSPVLTANTMDRQVAGSVGVPLPDVELRLAEKEIQARGPNIFPGYYQNEAATQGAFTPDGWFRTGDLGEIGADGWLTIKGREKELIVTGGGVNVFPDELEAVLNRTPGVREACVIGVDRGGGEEVHAVLLLDESGVAPETIVAQANRQLDSLHQITGYSIWKEPEFPKTTTLKIRKFVVKEEILKGGAPGGAASRDRLTNLIASVTGTSAGEIREESLLMADLGLTSIGRLELVNYLEQEFRLDVDEAGIGPQTRVSDLRRMVQTRENVRQKDHLRFWTNAPWARSCRAAWDRIFHFPLLRMMESLEIRGAERLDALQGPVLFIANHLSYLDQPSIMYALPPGLRYRTATAAWEEFFFQDDRGLAARLWKRLTYDYGTLFFNLFPLPQSKGFSRSFRFMGKLVDNGISILIFPEGAHSRDGQLQLFQPGLGLIVKELGVAVVPIKVEGTGNVLNPDTLRITPGKVRVTFGAPLRFGPEEPETIVAKSRQAVQNL